MEYIIDIEYDLDYDEEQILDHIRMIRGVQDIEEYNASKEIVRLKATHKRMVRHHKKRADDYLSDMKRMAFELKECQEQPQGISKDPDYVELVSLRAENQKLIVYEGILNRVQKDIDISGYINDP
jgi:uncharacterized protein YktA (UPF0223 family)